MAYISDNKEVIRIRVKKCDGLLQPEYKKLCVDPQITSFEILQTLLVRAFNIKSDFSVSYLATDDAGQDVYLSMLSDWDLDAAFLGSSSPYLCLKVDLKPFEEGLADWDIVARCDLKPSTKAATANAVLDTISKAVSTATKAIGLRQEEPKEYKPQKAAMSDAEFRNFQDAVGCLIQPQQFRLAVYQAGVETSLRRVVWRHLLNIYPDNMTGRERFDYLKKKSNEYFKLRDEWHGKTVADDKKNTMNMVKKDVLRTDRHHPFYAGTDENQNVISLFNILVTFALTHPDISYCQGMSDLASPLLVIEKDEASAYVCFCGLMRRLRNNFSVDGLLMTSRFEHLSLLLQHHDPIFHGYLTQHNADLFFCYRWILLEMKREFPLDDALFVLEVMWSTLPIDPPETELDLVDPTYYCKISSPLSNSRCTFNYVQLSKRRLSANQSFCDGKTGAVSHAVVRTPCDDASNTDGSDFCSIKLDEFEEIAKKSSEIEKSLSIHSNQSESADAECSEMEVNDIVHGTDKGSNIVSEIVDGADPFEEAVTIVEDDGPKKLSPENINPGTKSRVGLDLNLATACYVASQQSVETDGSEEVGEDVSLLDSASIDFVKVTEAEKLARLPPPSEFGCGNPFLMFLCLSLLLQHRDHIMSSQMDYNDTAIYYDRMVRRHNAFQVVQQAQSLYGNYLRQQQLESDSSDSPDPSV